MAPSPLTSYVEPDAEVTGASEADLDRVAREYGRALPADYVALITTLGGYNGDLLAADGAPLLQFPVNDADGVLSDSGYASIDDLDGISVAGTDDWRIVLVQHGDQDRYARVGLGSGDVEIVWSGRFTDVLDTYRERAAGKREA
ncbi:hypothetical protein ACPYO6_01240 [Georgenia sp. Z1344]|uniref:hypothetical protein n=1 Tax=Georgenia sp. Z1344 TaxID=3416706 RepID=UPI003CF25E59